MSKLDLLNVSGWMMTALGLTVAYFQYLRTRRIKKRSKEEMLGFIDRANYVSFEHELIDELSRKISDPVMVRYLCASHQSGCDLYRNLVNYYLSLEETFTYEDLKKLCQTPLITYTWQ